MSSIESPTVFILFGATGDLVKKKIIPALFLLYREGKLPKQTLVLGYARKPWTDQSFQDHARTILAAESDTVAVEAFVGQCGYQQGQLDEATSYDGLKQRLAQIDADWGVAANSLFYLAVPPELYATIFSQLAKAKLVDPARAGALEGWTRLIIEKPFGSNTSTAIALNEQLKTYFAEEQIYRIDHYLAKDTLQNILAFRFANSLFEETWNNHHIERIDIRLLEALGVETRGAFYDQIGALRDVGQNHLLAMLAVTIMERPADESAVAIRRSRAKALHTALRPYTEAEVARQTFRAQYQGYRSIEGVNPDSSTETYYYAETVLQGERWGGVVVSFESGKRMERSEKDVTVTFKGQENKVVFRMEPDEGIEIGFVAKKPGLAIEFEERQLAFQLHAGQAKVQYVEEYAKLLLDCIAGSQQRFVSPEELGAMWRFIDPIIHGWEHGAVPLASYAPDSQAVRPIASEAIEHGRQVPVTVQQVGIVGLGKMGAGLATQLVEKGWQAVGYNRSPEPRERLAKLGVLPADSVQSLVEQLPAPRVIWLMLPAGAVVDEFLFGADGLATLLEPGDTVIDGGNSYYKDAIGRAEKLAATGISFLDVGISGGPAGARHGACLMIGGNEATYQQLEPLFRAISLPGGYQWFQGMGAGHFVKMVHNGIEYGMMQAIAEGVDVLRHSSYDLNLERVAEIYQNGSVIESRLVEWLRRALVLHGPDFLGVSGSVAHTGEGAWTVEAARELGLKAAIIEGSLQFRIHSAKDPSYAGQVLSALRGQFGGHATINNTQASKPTGM